jgi:hypothetical protein
MTAPETPTQPASEEPIRTVTFEDFVTGRLALVTIRNQLQNQIAGLRSQLAIADSQLRQTEDLLRQADEKMATLYPDAVAFLEGSAKPSRKG